MHTHFSLIPAVDRVPIQVGKHMVTTDTSEKNLLMEESCPLVVDL